MKKITISFLLLFFALQGMGQTLTILPQNPTICVGSSVTLKVPSSGSNYQWSPLIGLSDSTGDSVVADPSLTTIYTVTGLDSVGQNVSGTDTVSVSTASPLTILPLDTIFCAGQSAILYVSGGGSNYQWSPSSSLNTSTGDSVVASPSITTTYTVSGMNTNGCATSGTDVVTVVPSPNKPTFFQQDGDTLISSSKHNNQWFRNDTLLVNDTDQELVITMSGRYWVTVSNEANGCSVPSDSLDVIINPSSVIIEPQNPAICIGQNVSVTLWVTTVGTYTWSPSTGLNVTTGYSVIASPTVTTTYTVIGLDSAGKAVEGMVVVRLGTPPTKPIIFLSQTGDSIASSADDSNQWLLNGNIIPGATNQIYVPNINGYYQVQITSPSGCTSASDSILIDREHVWPGDANDDLVVNNYDLIPIGLYYGLTGTPRDTTTNVWGPHVCADWDTIQANGINVKYADCNGDGTINADDTVAITLNYGLHHPLDAPRQAGERASGTVPLTIVPDSSSYHAGSLVHVSVLLGTSGNPATNIYGLGYTISFDNSLVEPGTLTFNYANSFLGTKGTNALTLTHIGSDVETAIVGTDHSNKNGNGKIGDLYFTITASSSQLGLSINSYEATDAEGNQIALATGISQLALADNKISIYPNPTTGAITIISEKTIDEIKVTNVLGQLVYEAQPNQSNINFELKDAGIYFIAITSNNETGTQKIIVTK